MICVKSVGGTVNSRVVSRGARSELWPCENTSTKNLSTLPGSTQIGRASCRERVQLVNVALTSAEVNSDHDDLAHAAAHSASIRALQDVDRGHRFVFGD